MIKFNNNLTLYNRIEKKIEKAEKTRIFFLSYLVKILFSVCI